MSWTPLPVMCCPLLAGLKNMLCSPTTSCSTPTVLNHSRCTTCYILYCISQHIWYTWDRYLPPSSLDIRWQDETGDTFALRNEDRLIELLREYRLHWTEGQEFGILLPNNIRYFTSHYQPYIMHMGCHEAFPNRNMLP